MEKPTNQPQYNRSSGGFGRSLDYVPENNLNVDTKK